MGLVINELDLAALRHEFRQLYRHLGYDESVVVLYELLKSAEVLTEVIVDEKRMESK